MSRYRVEAKTSEHCDSFIVGFFTALDNCQAITKAIDSLQLKGFLVSERILTAYELK